MDKKKICYLILLCLFSLSCTLQAEKYETVSPDGKLKIKLKIDNGTQYEVWYDHTQLILPSSIGLHLADGRVIGNGNVKSAKKRKVDQTIDVPVGKNKVLQDAYNELTISFTDNYDLVVRAYDEGVAYQFVTRLDGEITIISEDAIFNFASTPTIYYPECDANYSGETDQSGRTHRYIRDTGTSKGSIKCTKVRWKFLTNISLFLRYYTNIPILPIK